MSHEGSLTIESEMRTRLTGGFAAVALMVRMLLER
jgi:hypothetical protein